MITPVPRLMEEENEKGHTLSDYRKALVVMAKKYGYNLISGQDLPINPANEEDKLKYIFDGVHLSSEGHKIYADYIIEQIKDVLL